LINKLKEQNKKSFLIYASDHGESLGEHGLYLHGVPIKFAPEEQIHIPFFIWFSELYKQERSFTILDAKTKISHEHYPHTILDAMQVTSKYFKKEKSLLR
jgi:lipid A ethanolaminephosphotransferase